MSNIPVLKKKLRGVRATEKLSKAMKTVSAAKYSQLSKIWKNYSLYASQYLFSGENKELPCGAVAVLGSERGFCGGFNIETVSFLETELGTETPELLISCGEQMTKHLKSHGYKPDRTFSFGEVPSYSACGEFFSLLTETAKAGKSVKLVFPQYKNTVTQTPGILSLTYGAADFENAEELLFIPEREYVINGLSEKCFCVPLFGAVLETALGAQAATLMTMRSAYDTAREYGADIENKIHRLRQSEVTADVLETSSELHAKGDDGVGR